VRVVGRTGRTRLHPAVAIRDRFRNLLPRHSWEKPYCRTGKYDQTREHLSNATAMCRDMCMTYGLDKAEHDIPAFG
jgi:hypothetical protein